MNLGGGNCTPAVLMSFSAVQAKFKNTTQCMYKDTHKVRGKHRDNTALLHITDTKMKLHE